MTPIGKRSGSDYPVKGVAIVGVEPMLVEWVDARLTRSRVLGAGAMSGTWLGQLMGLLPILLGFVASGSAWPRPPSSRRSS